ncbi:MAG: carbon monoxide dehydrogenase subunit G [Gemmatimonadota bacterium]|jgi:carbon monoxide dehydrogenase subunit G
MKVEGEYLFEGPQDLVWETLLDPEVLASVLPGCEKLELVGEDEYEGALKIKMGPVQGAFMGKVKLEDKQPPDSYTMQVDGRGAPGFVKATGHLSLEPQDERTRVTYEGDAQVGGRLASVGQRLVESSAKAIIKQSLDGLNEAVRDRAAPAAAGSGAEVAEAAGAAAARPKRKEPTQAAFAANVAKDVARDLIPAPVRWVGGVVLAVAVLYVLYILVT